MSKVPAAPDELVAHADAMCDYTHVPPAAVRDGLRGRLRAQTSGSPGLEHITSIMRGVTPERRRVDQLSSGALGTVAGGIAEAVQVDECTQGHRCSGCRELDRAAAESATEVDAGPLAVGGAKRLPLTLTVEEAGQVLGISRTAAYRAVKRGELPVMPLSGRLHVPTAKLLRLLGIEHPCDRSGRGTS